MGAAQRRLPRHPSWVCSPSRLLRGVVGMAYVVDGDLGPSEIELAVERLRAAGCVFAEEEAAEIAAVFSDHDSFRAAVDRRTSGLPLEHALGRARFGGITVEVVPPVFVPRRRAESLVGAAIDRSRPGAAVVDLGCGSGAIAAAVKHHRADLVVLATDIDPEAVSCARRNGLRFGYEVHEGDWFDGLPARFRSAVHVVVAHLPYVPTAQLDLLPIDYRTHERPLALDGGPDGLDPLRQVVREVGDWLVPDGVLLTQVTPAQVPPASIIARDAGMTLASVEAAGCVLLALGKHVSRAGSVLHPE